MKIKVFVVRRLGGERLILHPFGVGSELFRPRRTVPAGTADITVLLRDIPSPAESSILRPSLEAALRKGLKEWLLDSGFIVRVALSSVAFLVIYLFFSIVVRDPVPILDEFTLGVIGTVFVWRLHSSRALASPAATAAASRALKELESAPYETSTAVAWTEERLAELDSPTPPDPAHWLDTHSPHLEPADRTDLKGLRDALARYLCRTTFLGPENPSRIETRARSALRLDSPLGRTPSLSGSGKNALYALYLKILAELKN